MPNDQDLSVGQLASRSGMTVSALHFYERQGLIRSRRTSGNQRRYDRSVLRRVAVIRAAQRAGIPLATVATAFGELPTDGVPDQEDWQRLSAAWRQEIEQRIAQLEQRLGKKLIEPDGRHIRLTPQARELLARVAPSLAEDAPSTTILSTPRDTALASSCWRSASKSGKSRWVWVSIRRIFRPL